MKHITLLLLILPLFIGCFDSQPPQGVVGQIVGCVETENAIFCITEYAKTAEIPPAPVPSTTPPTSANFTDIVSSAANGSQRYVGQTVTFTATVKNNLVISGGKSITLETNNDLVAFFITAFENPDTLLDYQEDTAYTFTVYIDDIRLSNDFSRYNIWSHEVD